MNESQATLAHRVSAKHAGHSSASCATPLRRGPLPKLLCADLFTNHKFRVGLHVGLMFGLNDRHIPIQYPSWSVKGFGEAYRAINSSMGEALWTLAFLF